jgi:hypothetical protein
MTIRILAVSFGVFLLGTSALDIAGYMPHSDETPPLKSRVRSAIVPAAIGLILLLPQRYLHASPLRKPVLLLLLLPAVWSVWRCAESIVEYSRGLRSWQIVPTALGVAALFIANALVFVLAAPKERPGV